MGTVPPDELMKLWRQGKMDPEMAVGHLTQNQVKQEDVFQSANLTVYRLKAEIDRLQAALAPFTAVDRPAQPKKKQRRP